MELSRRALLKGVSNVGVVVAASGSALGGFAAAPSRASALLLVGEPGGVSAGPFGHVVLAQDWRTPGVHGGFAGARGASPGGVHEAIEGSAFVEVDGRTPTGLGAYLRERGIARVWVAGHDDDASLAATLRDARAAGFEAQRVVAG